MKITAVRSTAVRLDIEHAPYPPNGAGTRFHHFGRRSRVTPKRPTPILEYLLVTIETDEGVVGVGESQVDIGFFGHTLEDVQAAVDDYLGPQLVGLDPFDREHLMSVIDFRGNSCAKAGIDLALHDLIGRALGVPVSTLLGGRHTERVRAAVEIAGGAPDAMARECLRFQQLGVHAFKAKIGGHVKDDADRLRAMREAIGPDAELRADANQGYEVKEAIRLCRLTERYEVDLSYLEQPVAAWDLPGMAVVRASVDVPIAADEACYTPQDAYKIASQGAADLLVIKSGKAGGLLQAKKIIAVAEATGLGCTLGTAFGLGVEMAAKLHLAASSPSVRDTVEFTEIGLHDNLLAPPDGPALALPVDAAGIVVPHGPGLGVLLDDEKVARHTVERRA